MTLITTTCTRFGHKRGRQINLIADQKLYDYCKLRGFKLDFTGKKLICITQAEKARMMAAKQAADQAKQRAQDSSQTNRQTYGQHRRQGGQDAFQGKRPRN
jgi:hypothetical protein